MVEVVEVSSASDIRDQSTSRTFPQAEEERIVDAIKEVPERIFTESEHGREVRKFDGIVAEELPSYEFEHAPDSGRNPRCKLWEKDGFDHSVDLYQPEERIAIEIEKSERKRVSDDLLKFIRGGKTQRENRAAIEFGCLIVPVNYRGNGNIFQGSLTTIDFMRRILFVEDVLVIGYRDPRWQYDS